MRFIAGGVVLAVAVPCLKTAFAVGLIPNGPIKFRYIPRPATRAANPIDSEVLLPAVRLSD